MTNAKIKSNEPFKTIIIDHKNPKKEDLNEIVQRYKENHFAIFKFDDNLSGDKAVLKLSELINLGEPFVPEHYKNNKSSIYGNRKLNTISSGMVSNHKAFHQQNNQDLHSDGTVHEIGFIKTTVLFCESEASVGGDTILFNSVGAFKSLQKADPEAAEALLNPECLVRVADIGQESKMTGPAFAFEDGELISRFTLDHTAKWSETFDKIKHLESGYNYLRSLAQPGSKYYSQFSLKSGEGIIFANDKIAHGRLSFVNSGNNERKMVRGLFLGRP